jgi:hypothetical protein
MLHPPVEEEEHTPEERRLLRKAYRLILSWKRDEPKTNPSPSDIAGNPKAENRSKEIYTQPEASQGDKKDV